MGTAFATTRAGRVQATIPVRAEHLRRRREAQENAYRAFIHAAYAYRYVRNGLDEELPDMTAHLAEVALVGPTQLISAAAEVTDRCKALTCLKRVESAVAAQLSIEVARRAGIEQYAASGPMSASIFHESNGVLVRFIALARKVLDDDGFGGAACPARGT
ncbi:hypothetical protein DDE74_39695 [Streptomyces lydicus]|uniref:Uncharacterized protein n=1 Tax=Streptomyces lydicus TaxID=47763 RepID=A0A3Q9KB27_9ACTN|nr:hypothetical protein DDE74_39695 [Streptomyces lydicus]